MNKYLLLIITAALMVAACSPSGVELAEPETPEETINPDSTNADSTNIDGTPANEPSEANNFNNNHYWLVYKEGKFELLNIETNERGQFRVDEAERLLRMSEVWTIPKDAPYSFSDKNGLRFEREMLRDK